MAVRAAIHEGDARALGGLVIMDFTACIDIQTEFGTHRDVSWGESHIVGGVEGQIGAAAVFRGRVVMDIHTTFESGSEAVPVVKSVCTVISIEINAAALLGLVVVDVRIAHVDVGTSGHSAAASRRIVMEIAILDRHEGITT